MIAAPIIARLTFVVPVTPTTQAVYDYIQRLEANSLIVLSFDYSPNSAPELHPQAIVIAQHAFMKQLKIIIVGHWTDGPTLGEAVLESVDKRGAEYGTDYVNLGFIPNVASDIGMTQDFVTVFPRDIRGMPTAEMLLLRLFPNAREAALVVSFTGGEPGINRYLQYWNAPFDIPVAMGSTALAAPGYLPFYDSGQLVGILISLRAAGEYETLIRTDNISGAASAMVSLSLAHITIVGAVVVGNLALLLSRRNRGGAKK
jgi:hypothetical protein